MTDVRKMAEEALETIKLEHLDKDITSKHGLFDGLHIGFFIAGYEARSREMQEEISAYRRVLNNVWGYIEDQRNDQEPASEWEFQSLKQIESVMKRYKRLTQSTSDAKGG